MSRSRNIKPSFFTNDELSECEPLARLLFAGLWCEADREGRLEDRPKRIKVSILPYDDCDCDSLLTQLHSAGFITRYEVSGVRLIQIEKFAKHQNPHRSERESTLPEIPEHSTSTVQARCKNSTNTEVVGLIPSSLIPSSLIPSSLIPDSLISDSLIPDSPPNVAGEGDTEPQAESTLPAVAQDGAEWWQKTMAAYPERAGSVDEMKAQIAWANCCRKFPPADVHDAVVRYAQFIQATGKERTEFVLQPDNFFRNPSNIGNPWHCPETEKPAEIDWDLTQEPA